MICLRCLVTGRVQGVFFRESTRQEAESLGVTGSAENLPDGRVEVLACGEEPSVRALVDWLWRGPRLAEVEDVKVEEVELENIPGRFATR